MDITITCVECGKKFILTQKEQDWYKQKDYNFPKRCPACRANRRNNSIKKEEM